MIEFSIPSLLLQYSCVVYGQPGCSAPFYVTAGRDKICRLRHIINGACEHEVKIDGCQITALALVDHNRTLLAATDEGSVRVYPWFGNKHPGEWSGEKPGRFEELRLHQVRAWGVRIQFRSSAFRAICLICSATSRRVQRRSGPLIQKSTSNGLCQLLRLYAPPPENAPDIV